jgi:segregation and condensation protein A
MTDYKVQFEVFVGPLDLLLYLVKKEEVDIYEVNLTKIATQFLEYIEVMRQLDLDVAGEFLVMAATLMYIKSRELLPVDQQTPTDEEEDEDPRWELIRQLVEYRKFKDAATRLRTLEVEQEQIYERRPAQQDLEITTQLTRPEATLFDLLSAVSQVLKRFEHKEQPRDIFEDRWSVSDKIEHLRSIVLSRPAIRFSELFASTTSRSEVVVTFLALLELIRLHIVLAVQEQLFGEIEIRSHPTPPAGPESTTPTAENSATPQVEHRSDSTSHGTEAHH